MNVTKGLCTLALLATASSVFAAEQLIWQLGEKNGSEADFKPHYYAWEYGNAPEISKSPAMDFKTHTFNYEIKENKAIPRPELVSGLATEYERRSMNNDEIVSGAKLSWTEAEAGTRRLELNLVNWCNYAKGNDGIEITLPKGGRKIVNLPGRMGEKNEMFKFEVLFPVVKGANSLTVRIVSMAKHYRFQFDSIALFKTELAPEQLEPVLACDFNAPDGIYHPGENVALGFKAFNLPDGNGEVNCSVEDAFGRKVTEVKAKLKDSTGNVELPATARGWFKVDCKLGTTTRTTSYVVLEPVQLEYLPDSRFGCHMGADGYRIRNWQELQETGMRRAFLGGSKWVRHHSVFWFLREPEKGKYDWTYLDDRLALAEKYKLKPLFTLGGTPKWASTSGNVKMTNIGVYHYQFCPPKDWRDWQDFVSALVLRYKDRVQWYELWNEPAYSSAYWLNGSPKDFGMLLKTGYEAAKKADPNCVILSGAPLSMNFFEESLKSVGGKRYFDIMSVHYVPPCNSVGGEAFSDWRSLLAKFGGQDTPFVNSEELIMFGAEGKPLNFPAKVLKVHAYEASLGIEKTFLLDFFSSGSAFGAEGFDVESHPLPQYAAYRTCTHRLEKAKFVADLSTSENAVYLFDRQGTPVLVLWSDRNGELELPLGTEKATLIDIMDVETQVNAANGKLKMKLSYIPQILEGGDKELLTAYGRLLKSFPRELVVKPGETAERSLSLDSSLTALKLTLPTGWNGGVEPSKIQLSVPGEAPEGIYDVAIQFMLGKQAVSIPVLVEVNSAKQGSNLIRNGDFSQGSSHWFFAKEEEGAVVKGAGVDGKAAIKTKGTAFFGPVSKGIKVRPGERYLVLAEAKGDGLLGGVYSLCDKDGKRIFPPKPGIDCLVGKLNQDWSVFSEEINIAQPDAAFLNFAVLANYGDKEGKEAFFNRFAIVRLTDKFPRNKALWQGTFVKTKGEPSDWNAIPAMTVDRHENVVETNTVKWANAGDLSASCRMALDDQFLYLLFSVKDDVSCPPTSDTMKNPWTKDSIQFSFDPTMEGRYQTEILVACDKSGKGFAFKNINFWTAELPTDLTRQGLMPDVEVATQAVAGGMNYKVKIPLRELYPLTAKTKEFGFSWLVNDDDGQGRKYIQWSSGIGPNKVSSLFGIVREK